MIPYNDVIEKYVSNGGNIKNSMFVHSLPELEELSYIDTKYGRIECKFNPYLPNDSMWIVAKTAPFDSKFTFE
jgi:hypothetical protein